MKTFLTLNLAAAATNLAAEPLGGEAHGAAKARVHRLRGAYGALRSAVRKGARSASSI